MSSLLTLTLVYLLGGLTFVPIVLGLILLHAYFTSPHRTDATSAPTGPEEGIKAPDDDGQNILSGSAAVAVKLQQDREKDVAEGYFAVCREYVPGGINGKPPVRTTPAGQVIAQESPSVYQNMYRSLFERRQQSSLDSGKGDGSKAIKRARNIFYVVLRHGHLMLYDDLEQVEVRHVISLEHHDVSIYGGGNEIPEGELWIKRNAICLRRMSNTLGKGSSSLPFFFFSENCSEKEDFYFALLRSQERSGYKTDLLPQVQDFELKDVISLVQRLHSSEEHLQTRWLNALVGRLFLALYKTQTAEDFIRMKITKKIARVKKPAFLSGIVLNKIDLGHAAPLMTNPKMKDLTVEGEYCAESNVSYEGCFRIEIAATARLDLGPRFKAREVNILLAVVVKKLEGKLLVRLKPPPSNRIWVAFESMPHLELSIEPIVSSRQITYGIILRAIESRIREVLAETIVLPHWDDSPFLDTTNEGFRGGIWTTEKSSSDGLQGTAIPDDSAEDEADTGSLNSDTPVSIPLSDNRTQSTPGLLEPKTGNLTRRNHQSTHSLADSEELAISSGVQKVTEMPKVLRSKSFASAADPVVNTNNANSDASKEKARSSKLTKDAVSFMSEISHRSQPSSPINTPVISRPVVFGNRAKSGSFSSASSITNGTSDSINASQSTLESHGKTQLDHVNQGSPNSRSSSTASNQQQPTKLQAMAKSWTPSEKKQQAMLSAATAAKNWSWNTFNRNRKPNTNGSTEKSSMPDQPLGRGRPLPPPGQPLPLPDKRASIASFTLPKRKPVPKKTTNLDLTHPPSSLNLSHKARKLQDSRVAQDHGTPGMLVVEAPAIDSEPTSPIEEDGYGEFMDNVTLDDEEDNSDGKKDESSSIEAPDPKLLEDSSTSINHRAVSSPISSSYEDEDSHGLTTWKMAQEQEARSKSVWMDDQEHS